MAEKKKKGRKVVKKVEFDQIPKLINKVQLDKKEVKFAVTHELSPIVENILSDSGIEYNKDELTTKVNYHLIPSFTGREEEFLEMDEITDDMFWEAQGSFAEDGDPNEYEES